MIRHAVRMHIPPEHAAEYKKRHDEIWPELIVALKEAGISDYSIFFDQTTGDLFAIMKLDDNHQLERLGEMEIMKTWWASNTDIQTYDGGQPFARQLDEVFHLNWGSAIAPSLSVRVVSNIRCLAANRCV